MGLQSNVGPPVPQFSKTEQLFLKGGLPQRHLLYVQMMDDGAVIAMTKYASVGAWLALRERDAEVMEPGAGIVRAEEATGHRSRLTDLLYVTLFLR